MIEQTLREVLRRTGEQSLTKEVVNEFSELAATRVMRIPRNLEPYKPINECRPKAAFDDLGHISIKATAVHQGLRFKSSRAVEGGTLAAFDYTSENLAQIEQSLSLEKLAPGGGSLEMAVRLYEQNTLLSEGLYGILQGLEIALRNAMHLELTTGLGSSSWWTVVTLEPDQQRMLHKAQDALVCEGKPLDADRVVAELSFGFWTGLFAPKYTDL